MTHIRLGVIGAGLIWMRAHQRALAQLSDTFEPVAFCDVDADRRAIAARDFPGAVVTRGVDELLSLPNVDAALVLTPIALNAPTALAAVRAGKHVIMEKPITRSVAEGEALVQAARQAGRRLFVAEQMAYRSAEDTLAAVIGSGDIGDLVMWNCVRHFATDPDPEQGPLRFDTAQWRKTADFPLGSMFDGGVHLIAVLGKVFGQPYAVTASGRKLRPDYGAYDQVTALLEYPGPVTGLLSYSQFMPPMQSHFHVHGSAGIIVVESDRLVVQRHNQAGRVVTLERSDGRMEMWRAFAHAFRDGIEPFYTPERALQDVGVLEAADRSIATGQRVRIYE